MAMFHHDTRQYEVAASEMAQHMRTKLGKLIEAGRKRTGALLERLPNEQPIDRVRKANQLANKWHVLPATDKEQAVVVLGNGIKVGMPTSEIPYEQGHTLHPHAFSQACQRVKLPHRYARELLSDGSGWAAELLQRNLRDLYEHSNARLLLRTFPIGPWSRREFKNDAGKVLTANLPARGEERGILSDAFKRLDSAPLIEAFAKAVSKAGLVPIDGTGADTKWSIRAICQDLFEPIENEVMAFGLELKNSDYGASRLTLAVICLRPWCTNYATTKNELSKVHLGARLPEDLRLSRKTYELDTETTASAIYDLTKDCLSPKRIDTMCDAIKAADDSSLDWTKAKQIITKRLNKSEVEQAKVLFESTNDGNVPKKQSRWKLSNAISWLANQTENADRKLDLQSFAGELIN